MFKKWFAKKESDCCIIEIKEVDEKVNSDCCIIKIEEEQPEVEACCSK